MKDATATDAPRTPALFDASEVASLYPSLTQHQFFALGQTDALLAGVPHVWLPSSSLSSGRTAALGPAGVPDIRKHYADTVHDRKQRYVALACHGEGSADCGVRYTIVFGDVGNVTNAGSIASLYPWMTPQQLVTLGQIDSLLAGVPRQWVAAPQGLDAALALDSVADIKTYIKRATAGFKSLSACLVLSCRGESRAQPQITYRISFD